ncbi:MAG TPA: O-antigen polymerase [Pyrinomonadaceae bacterium]|nr:O-antigen polymerase [Pyrinomonadaceae bacterium]
MAIVVKDRSFNGTHERYMAPAIVLMLLTLLVGGIFVLLSSDLAESFPHFYLLPWVAGLLVVLSVPTLYLYYHGRLTLIDPLVFATWSYFFPAFVIGGLMLITGWSQPYFFSFIQDAKYNLPYTVVLIALGHAGLAAGYFFPLGPKLGAAVNKYLPTRDFSTSALLVPGLFLLLLGTLNTAVALFLGIIGYQRNEVIDPYSGTVFLTTLFWMQGSFILWYFIFRTGKFNFKSVALILLLFGATVTRALFSGNRAALFQVFVIVLLAFILAGRTLDLKRTAIAGITLSICLFVGMIYGTTFRNVKGSEAQVSIDQYTQNIFETFDNVGRFDLEASLVFALTGLAARLDTLSSVAVVVSNYEELQPYEESYGLDNNIWKDTSTFFIPRMLWNEKPVASEPRKFSDLYFDYGENSFAITPMGDLLRNYGPVGVPVGMFLFGIVIRFLYRSLIEDQPKTMWRVTMYFMLLMAISYESFYGMLIPFLFKVGITAIVGLLIVGFVARILGHRRTLAPA